MGTQAVSRLSERMPSVFDDFFKPCNEWFDSGGFLGRTINVPAVNITEQKDHYLVSLAAPGMKKEDFNIDVDGNMLTISSQKEESKEEKSCRGDIVSSIVVSTLLMSLTTRRTLASVANCESK